MWVNCKSCSIRINCSCQSSIDRLESYIKGLVLAGWFSIFVGLIAYLALHAAVASCVFLGLFCFLIFFYFEDGKRKTIWVGWIIFGCFLILVKAVG